jgi:hypothetical protein
VDVLATGCAVPQWADSISTACGRGNWALSAPNSADGSDGSIGSVGAPWDRKSEGKRFMAAAQPRKAAQRLGCYQYRAEPRFDKRAKTELIVSQML